MSQPSLYITLRSTQHKTQHSLRPPTDLQHSKKILHHEADFIWSLNKNVDKLMISENLFKSICIFLFLFLGAYYFLFCFFFCGIILYFVNSDSDFLYLPGGKAGPYSPPDISLSLVL